MRVKYKNNFPIWLILIAAGFVFLRNAWVSDDAMITFRTVMNLLHGYGPVFSPGERVQSYTHPLWFLFITLGTFIFGNIYIFTFIFSILIALFVLFVLANSIKEENSLYWIWILALLLSKAFVEYSTSGLENSLSHLMLVSGFALGFYFLKTNLKRYALASLLVLVSIYLSRPDLILMTLPFCVLIFCRLSPNARIRYAFYSLIPIGVWTFFSVIYYGFPFPNTAYAKLNNSVPQMELIVQGSKYFWDSLCHDPITLSTIIFSLLASVVSTRKEIKAIALGVGLYLIYVVWIGGDFMSGRFMTASLVCAVFILQQIHFSLSQRRILGAGVLLIGLISIRSTFLSPINVDLSYKVPNTGITDEKRFFYHFQGWLSPDHMPFDQPTWEKTEKSFRRTCGNLGQIGMDGGPSILIVDMCGLSDPLLARLPPYRDKNWRIGHFYRQVPTNYDYLVFNGDENALRDKPTLEFWKKLKVITQGPIFSAQRFKMIWKMNFGLVQKPDFNMYRNEVISSQYIPISVFERKAVPKRTDKVPPYFFVYSIELYFDKPTVIQSIDTSLYGENESIVQYKYQGQFYDFLVLVVKPDMINRYQIRLDHPTPPADSIRILDFNSHGPLLDNPALGHLYINRL